MAPEASDPLEQLAGAVADGDAIDWSRYIGTTPLPQAELRALETVDRIHRMFAHGTGAGSDTPAGGSAGKPGSGGTLGADFEIREELGRGSFATVYRALDRTLGREVALKILSDAHPLGERARERFLAEARVLASLDHPNIVRVFSVSERDGRLVICLERVVGRTLAEVIEQDGPLAPEEAARIGVDLCRALSALHAQGLVHRDLKPSNAMRATGGRIVLLDFGFARSRAGDPGVAPNAAAAGTLGGTPRFMSPEQFEGHADVGPAVDLYALGVMLYWLVTGEYPHEATSFDELRECVLAGRVMPLSDRRPTIPALYAAVVERALARVGQRFATAGEMERALQQFLAESLGVAPARPDPAPARPSGVAAVLKQVPVPGSGVHVFLAAGRVGGSKAAPSAAAGAAPADAVRRRGSRQMQFTALAVLAVAALVWALTAMRAGPATAGTPPLDAAQPANNVMKLIFLACALVGGVLLVLQIVLSLVGADHHTDFGHDVDLDHGGGAGTVSFRAVIAFLTFFGIAGMAALSTGMSPLATLAIALCAGGVAFWLMGLALMQFNKLRASGTVEVANAVGAEAKVYLNIPAEKHGEGMVTVPIQGRTMQYRAITGGRELKTGELCRVVAVHAGDTLVVETL